MAIEMSGTNGICQRELRQAGLPYPRTCSVCGPFGQCPKLAASMQGDSMQGDSIIAQSPAPPKPARVVAMCVHQDALYIARDDGVYRLRDGKLRLMLFADVFE